MDFDQTQKNRDYAISRSEFDAVREEVGDNLFVALLVPEDCPEVDAVDGFVEDGTHEANTFQFALHAQTSEALFDEFSTVEVVFDKRKGVAL